MPASHIVNSCPLTKFDGGLLHLHEADEAAVDWLTTWLLAHDNNNYICMVNKRFSTPFRTSCRGQPFLARQGVSGYWNRIDAHPGSRSSRRRVKTSTPETDVSGTDATRWRQRDVRQTRHRENNPSRVQRSRVVIRHPPSMQRYVFFLPLCVCLSVCLPAGKLRKLSTNSDELVGRMECVIGQWHRSVVNMGSGSVRLSHQTVSHYSLR